MNRIEEALIKSFESHRIIFWYDEKEELTDQFQEIQLQDVESIYVQRNEFEVKHRIYKGKPESKYLLYFTGDKPLNEDNWLLDLELANYVFHTDQDAMFLQELGLDYHLKELVSDHVEFFKSKERRLKLKELIREGDDRQEIQYKMLAVLFGTDNVSLINFIHAHGSAYADGNEKFEKDLDRFTLSNFYWNEIAKKFNYQNASASIYDFLMEVFNNNFALGKKSGISKESKLLLSLWQNTYPYRESFSKLSSVIAKDIGVEKIIAKANIEDIISDIEFELSDKKIIHELVDQIRDEEISYDRVLKFIKQRQNKFWFHEFENIYNVLKSASEFIQLVKKYQNTNYTSFNEGTDDYSKRLYRIDQLYRKYIRYYRKANQNKILSGLSDKVEKIYNNDWMKSHSYKLEPINQKLADTINSVLPKTDVTIV